eukprot:34436_1
MRTFSILFLILWCFIIKSYTSFTTYHGLKLPLNLFNHISVIYNDNIYIIGGTTENHEPSTRIYKSEHPINTSQSHSNHDMNSFIAIGTIHEEISSGPLPVTIDTITCANKCFTVMDNIIYIFLGYKHTARQSEDIILLKYDMSSASFIPLTQYQYFYNDTHPTPSSQFMNGCVLHDADARSMYSFGVVWSDQNRIGLRYDTTNDEWDTVHGNWNQYERHSMGCSMDYNNEHVYLFGGITGDTTTPSSNIHKYNLQSQEIVSLSTTLQAPRSMIQVVQRSGNYWILYSAGSAVIEYFDGNAQRMLTYDHYSNDNRLFDETNLTLNIHRFGWFITNDIWFISGGQNMYNENVFHSEIMFVDTSTIFDVFIDQTTEGMSCSTVYAPQWARLRDKYVIDPYIWRANSNILFKTISKEQQRMVRPSINIESRANVHYALEYNFTNNSLNALHLKAAYLRSGGGPLRQSKKTIYNAPYPSTMWASWDMSQLCSIPATPSTYFRGGVGRVLDRFASSYRNGYCFQSDDIETAYFYDYHEVNNTKWEFYHNQCRMRMDVYLSNAFATTFSIGDHLHLNATLWNGSRVNAPIYIVSQDILNLNHSLIINDTDSCMICDRRHTNQCQQCTHGIPITDLATYDVSTNKYTIRVYADAQHHPLLLSGPTQFEFVRHVIKMAVTFDDLNGNTIDLDRDAIYPLMPLYIRTTYDFDSTTPPQYEGTIVLEWDHALDMPTQWIQLQFMEDSCRIVSDKETMDCSQPIVIPRSMRFKSIAQNHYTLNLYSNDTQLTTHTVSIRRKIQNISVALSDLVAVGSYINITTRVWDDELYHSAADIYLYSEELDIKATIQITHTQCMIHYHESGTMSGCSHGIGPIYPTEEIASAVIHLESNDTYLSTYRHTIHIAKGSVGLILLDMQQQQIVFGKTPFYPGFHFYPYYYISNRPVPSQVIVYFEWDEAFNMGNKDHLQIMRIRFDTNQCTMDIDETTTIRCPMEPIIIPWNMTYKPILQNRYFFDVYSYDVELNGNGNAPANKTWTRAIQNISIRTARTMVPVDGTMHLAIEVQDEQIYQPHSTVHLYNTLLNINHTIHISYTMDARITDCTITDWNTWITSSCDEGIGPIQPNHESKHFKIRMRSEDTSLLYDAIPIDIIRMPLDIQFGDDNHTDIALNGVYPGLEIYVSVHIVDETVPTPSEAIVYVQWDASLRIGDADGTSVIVLQFDPYQCTIRLNTRHTLDCTQPIIVPFDMEYKSVDGHNEYTFDVYSYDVELTRQYPQYLTRKVQNIAINTGHHTYAVHEYIPLIITVVDTAMYQPFSNITIHNDVLGIDSQILIEYDLLSESNDPALFITNCVIQNNAIHHNKIEDCETGLGQIIPQGIVHDNTVMIELHSNNTYMVQDTISIQLLRMEVNITFRDGRGLPIDFNATYPGLEIFIDVNYDESAKLQHEGQIFLDWDPDLKLGGGAASHVMVIDFHQHECFISFEDADGDDQSCSEPIIIPINMTYRLKDQNYYTFDLYSYDTELISAQPPPFIRRKIQTIDVLFPGSVSRGRYISIGIDIMDDRVVQPTSTIRIQSDELRIDGTIFVAYWAPAIEITHSEAGRHDSDYILFCVVFNHYTDSNESCEVGIGPIQQQSLNQKLKDSVHLSSMDTILHTEVTEIPVITGELVDYNHWIAIGTTGSDIITSSCPNEYCCQDVQGCLYFDDDDDAYLCAPSRNHSVPLCGACDTGYAHVFNSADCQLCDTDHWEYLLFPLLIAFLVTLIMILMENTNDKGTSGTENTRHRQPDLVRRDEGEAIVILIFRICVVFYQCINYILWQLGYTFWGTIVVQILSLDSYVWFWIFSYPDHASGVCFTKDLNAMQYYEWYLYFPGCLLFALAMYILCKNTCCASCCASSTSRCRFSDYTICNVALIVFFPVLIVFVIMLSCAHLDDDKYGTVHFYAGDTQCYGPQFISAFIVLSALLLWFCWCWLYLHRLGNADRRRTQYMLKGMIRPYRPGLWWWEFVLLTRRILIAAFITFQYFDKMAMHITLLIVLFLFALLELKCDPFKHRRALYMDLICLLGVMLCLVIMIANIEVESNQMHAAMSATMISMSIVILVPLVVLLWYLTDSIWACHAIYNYHRDGRRYRSRTGDRMTRRIERMNQRLQMISTECSYKEMKSNQDREQETDIVPFKPRNVGEAGAKETDSDSEERHHENRDHTLEAIIDAECAASQTSQSRFSLISKYKRQRSSKNRHKYQEISLDLQINHQNNIIEVDDDEDDDDLSTTYSNQKQHRKTEMAVLDDHDDDAMQSQLHKTPFVRKKTKNALTAIQENPDKKEEMSKKHQTRIEVEESQSSFGDTYGSVNAFGVVAGDDSKAYITSAKTIKSQQNEPNDQLSNQYMGTHKSRSSFGIPPPSNTNKSKSADSEEDDSRSHEIPIIYQQHAHSATVDQSFNHTETRDEYNSNSSNDDDITADDVEQRQMQVVSTGAMTQNMKNIMDDTTDDDDSDDSSDTDATNGTDHTRGDYKQEEHEALSHRKSKHIPYDDALKPDSSSHTKCKPQEDEGHSMQQLQRHGFMGIGLPMDDDRASKQSYSSECGSITPFQTTPFQTPFQTPTKSKTNALSPIHAGGHASHRNIIGIEDKDDDSESDKDSVIADMVNDVLTRDIAHAESTVRKKGNTLLSTQHVTNNQSTEDQDIDMNKPQKQHHDHKDNAETVLNYLFEEDTKELSGKPTVSSSELFDEEITVAKKSKTVSDQQRLGVDTDAFEDVYSHHEQSETKRRRVKAGSVRKLLQRQVSNPPVASSSLKLHRSTSSLNTIDEDRKLDELTLTKTSTVDEDAEEAQDRINTPHALNSNQNDPSQNYEYSHMHTDQDPIAIQRLLVRNTSSTMSFRSESPLILAPVRSHGNQNQSEIEHEYEYEYVHHEQDHTNNGTELQGTATQPTKPRPILRISTAKDIAFNLSSHGNNDEKEKERFQRRKPAPAPPPRSERSRNTTSPSFRSGDTHSSHFSKHQQHKPTVISSTKRGNADKKFERVRTENEEYENKKEKEESASGSGSYSDASTEEESESVSSVDSEALRASWAEYRDNLSRLFYLFAGYQRWSKKKGIYMSRNEVKRFLEIVEITKYWSVDQVFEVMDNDIVDRKITLNEFVEYFCDCEMNPKASCLKAHIERQVSWTLLIKALRIFDKLDVDRSGQLEYDEFKQFGIMLKLNGTETEILWKTIDKDESGQITIVELFEWFKERLEAARQSRKPKDESDPGEFSQSHSSFDADDSTVTTSPITGTTAQQSNQNDDAS